MDGKEHWDGVYRNKAADAVSWYQPHRETSLRLIGESTPDRGATIIDVGGGESTLVDDLLQRGYRNLTVLDMSAVALNATKQGLGSAASNLKCNTVSYKVLHFRFEAAEFPGEYHGFENWHKRGDLMPPQLRHMTTVPGQ